MVPPHKMNLLCSRNVQVVVISRLNPKESSKTSLMKRFFLSLEMVGLRNLLVLAKATNPTREPSLLVINSPLARSSKGNNPTSSSVHPDQALKIPNLDFRGLPPKNSRRKHMLVRRDASDPKRHRRLLSLPLISLILPLRPQVVQSLLPQPRLPRLRQAQLPSPYAPKPQHGLSHLYLKRRFNRHTGTVERPRTHTKEATMQKPTRAFLQLLVCSLTSILSPLSSAAIVP